MKKEELVGERRQGSAYTGEGPREAASVAQCLAKELDICQRSPHVIRDQKSSLR